MRPTPLLVPTLLASLLAVAPLGAQSLDDGSFARWRDFVLPDEGELAWLEIPWRDSFWEAVREAREAERPVLLWAMNGHPLGCT